MTVTPAAQLFRAYRALYAGTGSVQDIQDIVRLNGLSQDLVPGPDRYLVNSDAADHLHHHGFYRSGNFVRIPLPQ